MFQNISKSEIITFSFLFIFLFLLSMMYTHDGRLYDGPLIRGFPLPYVIEPAQMICENYDFNLNKCLDERNFSFHPIFLLINTILILLTSTLMAYSYSKIKYILKK